MNTKTETRAASSFDALAAVDCSAYVEKKGKFSYLSWTFAVAELLKRYPSATWRVIETPNGSPYWQTDAGCFVKAAVTVEGVERTQVHPVLDGNNKTIAQPNAFQVNTSIQRAIVKAIALHGLGLYIYAGEDLPEAVKEDRAAEAEAEAEAHVHEFDDWRTKLKECACMDDLQDVWAHMPANARKALADDKDAAKARLAA